MKPPLPPVSRMLSKSWGCALPWGSRITFVVCFVPVQSISRIACTLPEQSRLHCDFCLPLLASLKILHRRASVSPLKHHNGNTGGQARAGTSVPDDKRK